MGALACGCAPTPAAPLAQPGGRINLNTPAGMRAQQIVDMLNSDWPIGPVGVKTLAAPDQVDNISGVMDGLWWDRPFTVSGVDIGADTATLHLSVRSAQTRTSRSASTTTAWSAASTSNCRNQPSRPGRTSMPH
jgi:hypothetical protein